VTFDELKKLVEGEGLRYFLAPDRPVVMMGFALIHGRYQVALALELEGRFVQLRTLGYQYCPSDHPHLEAVLRLIASLDYQLRLTKFGWDPTDGEIAAYADVWLEDGTLTQKQFSGMLHVFLPGIDMSHARITKTIETGTDPGEMKPEDLMAAAGAALPPELRAVLEGLAEKKPGEEPEGPEEV
jgi:hypothetical protein